MIDRSALLASLDPINDTLDLIGQNDLLVDAMDDPTRDFIRDQTDIAYALMGPTSMYQQTDAWHTALQDLAPHLDPDGRVQVEALLSVLEQHEQQGC
jgi:hypothetical protein